MDNEMDNGLVDLLVDDLPHFLEQGLGLMLNIHHMIPDTVL